MTSFVDRLLGRAPKAMKATYGGPWLGGYAAGGINLSSLNVDPQEKAAKLLQAYKCGWFNKAERKISIDFSMLAVTVAPEDDEGDNQDTVVEPDLMTPWRSLDPMGQFLRLMEKPNPYQSGRQLRQKTMIRLDMAGWAFWYTELGTDGLPTENGLYGISPARLTPSYNNAGRLIGYVLDKDRPGGGVPFDVEEIIPFSYGSADDDDIYGVGVVEAIWQHLPLTDAMARHTADVLATGGRMAGMLWPKERTLTEDEFVDAQRAWRSVASDPNAARRLLLFPEPMEWTQGAATPDQIGIPELAALNRDDILTAFPISPYQLGVPMPGGLNSAETRKEDRRDYWLNTIHPRVELFEETIQTYLVSKYEEAVGTTLDFEIAEPSLDDAPAIIEKAGAMDALIGLGFDPQAVVEAVGLEHIKWIALPALKDPAKQAEMAAQAQQEASLNVTATDTTNSDASQTRVNISKAIKSKDEVATEGALLLADFLDGQRDRVVSRLKEVYPAAKAKRFDWVKADPDWWDAQAEDDALRRTLATIYVESGRTGLQVVADTLGRIVPNKALQRVIADLTTYGGERIVDINARTLQAITTELAEGTRRGYSINQLIDGVESEGFRGILKVGLDNGVPVWSDARAETISRTETALSYNRAALGGYREFGVRRVLAYDGDTDAECAARNGKEFSVDDAFGIADHPNGTLDWAPVVGGGKAYDDETHPAYELATKAIDALTRPQDIHVHTTPPDVVLPTPVVNVEAPDLTPITTAIGELRADVKAIEPPVVNVPAPVVNVPAPVVNVKAPSVTDVRVTSLPDRKHDVLRDRQGKPIGSMETDA